MVAERDFWRLLADYEHLTRNESAALVAGAFEELAVLQDLKDPVLDKLRQLARETGLDRTHPQLASRVDQILRHAERNKQLIEMMLSRAHVERQNLDSARQRLRGLGAAYGPLPVPAGFSAHG